MNSKETEMVETLEIEPLGAYIEVRKDRADSIIIIDSDTTDMDVLARALKAQGKHGCLGEALKWLFLDHDGALVMVEKRDNPDWLKSYSAIYWFVSGWGDAEFYGKH
jgi:hypothetical protein